VNRRHAADPWATRFGVFPETHPKSDLEGRARPTLRRKRTSFGRALDRHQFVCLCKVSRRSGYRTSAVTPDVFATKPVKEDIEYEKSERTLQNLPPPVAK